MQIRPISALFILFRLKRKMIFYKVQREAEMINQTNERSHFFTFRQRKDKEAEGLFLTPRV